MDDDVDEALVDDLLKRYLADERQQLERQVRATPQPLVVQVQLAGPLHAATADRPSALAHPLGHRESTHDAEHRALMRVMDDLHNDPLPVSSSGRPPRGRGHRISAETEICLRCGARRARKTGWRTDCPKNPPHRIRSKDTCAVAVAEAAIKAGLTNIKGKPIDSDALLKMYQRWQRHGSPRDRAHERLFGKPQK